MGWVGKDGVGERGEWGGEWKGSGCGGVEWGRGEAAGEMGDGDGKEASGWVNGQARPRPALPLPTRALPRPPPCSHPPTLPSAPDPPTSSLSSCSGPHISLPTSFSSPSIPHPPTIGAAPTTPQPTPSHTHPTPIPNPPPTTHHPPPTPPALPTPRLPIIPPWNVTSLALRSECKFIFVPVWNRQGRNIASRYLAVAASRFGLPNHPHGACGYVGRGDTENPQRQPESFSSPRAARSVVRLTTRRRYGALPSIHTQ